MNSERRHDLLVEPAREIDAHIRDAREEHGARCYLDAALGVLEGDRVNTNPGTVIVPPERVSDVARLHAVFNIGLRPAENNVRRTKP